MGFICFKMFCKFLNYDQDLVTKYGRHRENNTR